VTVIDPAALAAYPPLGRLIEVGGLAVHATDTGSGAPPVVLLHGSNVNLRDWTFSLTDRLARTNRVIAMDRPGFGYSERGSGGWTPARQAAQLRAALAMLGVERPIVVGHSWGAVVAFAWALDAPREVSGIVSVSGATMPWGPMVDVLDGLGVTRAGASYYTALLYRRLDQAAVEAFVRRAFWPQKPAPGYVRYVGAPLSMRASAIKANSEDLGQTHAALSAHAKRYAGLDLPVEILHGEKDWLLTVSRHATGLARRLPNARVNVAHGVGHMTHHARPDLLEAAVARISAAVR